MLALESSATAREGQVQARLVRSAAVAIGGGERAEVSSSRLYRERAWHEEEG